MAEDQPGAAWHMEGHFGSSRGIVRVAERGGQSGIRVRLDTDGHEPVIFTVTPDQAGWLGEALPAALAMLRSWQEQRDWDLSMHDPFAAFDKDDPDGSEAAAGDVSNPSTASVPVDNASNETETVAPDIEDAPVPKRRGQPWSRTEEERLVEAWQAGQGVNDLAALLQRSPRAICKRLEKLELAVSAR